ncbi:MAG: hypothetical protein RIC15_11830 [Vicingaceae bacterium]
MNKLKVICLSLLTLIIFNLQAQKSDEDEIRDIITSFTSAVELLRTEGSAAAPKVLPFVSTSFRFDTKVINLMNVVTHETFDLKMVQAFLEQMKASDLMIDRNLGPLDDVVSRGNLAYAKYYNDYELYENDRLISKGRQFVELIFKKYDGKWKIDWMTSLEVDDIEYKGMCVCEIYENKGLKNIITETIVPDGSSVDFVQDKFSIDESTEPKNVRQGFRDYLWYSNGAVHRRNLDGSKGEQITLAKSRQELILNLLKTEVYPDRCFNVVRKLK